MKIKRGNLLPAAKYLHHQRECVEDKNAQTASTAERRMQRGRGGDERVDHHNRPLPIRVARYQAHRAGFEARAEQMQKRL